LSGKRWLPIAGADVPPGTVVMIAPWVLHRHRLQ
jgi:hypothetical protein